MRMKKPPKIDDKRMLKYWTLLVPAFQRLPREEAIRIWRAIGSLLGFS